MLYACLQEQHENGSIQRKHTCMPMFIDPKNLLLCALYLSYFSILTFFLSTITCLKAYHMHLDLKMNEQRGSCRV